MKIFTPLYLVFISLTAAAQIPGMKIYNRLDGYPGSVGYIMHQDSRGFIWIGTDDGAVCFDGQKFMVIDDHSGLTDKEILAAIPNFDSSVLLVPLLNNIAYYRNGEVINSSRNPALKKILNRSINHTINDPVTKKVWLCDQQSPEKIYQLHHDSLEEITLHLKDFSVIGAVNDRLYVARVSGAQCLYMVYNLRDHSCHRLSMGNTAVFPAGYERMSVDGRFLVSARKGIIYIYELEENSRLRLRATRTSQRPLKHIMVDKNNHLWLLFNGEGIEYHGHIDHLLDTPYNFLPHSIINHLLVDQDNNLWLTTLHEGLFFISARHWENALMTRKYKLPSYPASTITGDSAGRIYIGYDHQPYLTVIDKKHHASSLVKGGHVIGIKCMSNFKGHLCMGSSQTLYLLEHRRGGIHFSSATSTGTIKDLALYGDTGILLANHVDVSIAFFRNKKWNEKFEMKKIFSGRSTCVQALPDKNILIGTPNGMFRKASLNGEALKVKDAVLSQAHIMDISPAAGSLILVSTNGQGLFSYNYKTESVKRVGQVTGSIRQVYKQNDSTYWLATDRGAFKILLDSGLTEKKSTNYTFFDGLPSSNVSGIYVEHDTAYITTNAGLGIIPLADTSRLQARAPLIYITSARLDDTLVHFPRALSLHYPQNNVQLSLSALSFESIGKVSYAYKLEGLSDRWIETESHEISFSGLPPGRYQLWVYAINFRGIRSSSPLLLTIIVQPAFWQSWWFFLACVACIIALLFVTAYRIILSSKNKHYREAQQKRRLAELELEAIKAQINPHFIYNCLNSIQYFNYKNEHESAKVYLDLFAKLIRQTMKYSQKTFITLENEKEYLSNYLQLEKMRFKEKLNYEIQVSDDLPGRRLLPAMLVQPYVENALKHGIAKLQEKGSLLVSFTSTEEGFLCIRIRDNGPGLAETAANERQNHLGLRLSGARAATYNQLFQLGIEVNIHSGRSSSSPQVHTEGTLVELLIPPINYENITAYSFT